MKEYKFKPAVFNCKFCKREMKTSWLAYLENSFCSACYEDRLEASGAIDLRDNHRIVDLGNGYIQIEPIDPTKKWKKKEK